jgi:tetratricopeptide (TPR) repeat protein
MPPSMRPVDEHGFPIPPTFEDPTSQRRPSQWMAHVWQVGLVLVFMVLLAGWVFKSGFGDGLNDWIARRLVERAQQKYEYGDFQGALADLERASRWSPEEPDIFEMRAKLKLKTNDIEGSLKDFDQLIHLDPRRREAYLGRSVVYQRLNRFREATDDLTKAIAMEPGDMQALNNRAYVRALGGIELDAALADVQQALDKVEKEITDAQMSRRDRRKILGQVAVYKGHKAAYLDTRGYILFLQDKFEPALEDLSAAIELGLQWQDFVLSQIPPAHGASARRELNQELSVMYHHRGQVLEKLGRAEEAKVDLDQGNELGYNPAQGVF